MDLKQFLPGRRRPRARGPAPFIVGVTRSGTTLLRLMLDAHPQLTIPPETHFLPKAIRTAAEDGARPKVVLKAIVEHRRWNDFDLDRGELLQRLRQLRPLEPTGAIRAFYGLYAEQRGKRRWGDKTPGYQTKMLRIARALPEARFIHVIRDGRDVVLSQRDKADTPTPIDVAAKRWRQRVKGTRRRAEGLEHYLEVRYEELVERPEETLRAVCEFIELDYDPVMLRYHESAEERLQEIAKDLPARGGGHTLGAGERIAAHELATRPPTTERLEAWRAEMQPEEVVAFEQVAGDLLAELGYPLAGDGHEPGRPEAKAR